MLVHMELEQCLCKERDPSLILVNPLAQKASTWSTYDKEALAIIEAIKQWKHYYATSSLIIRTDQQSLKYIQEQKLTKGVQHKLLVKLLGYNYTIE